MSIAYASRSLKPAETRYTATEIECLGMKWAVNQFRPYVHGRRFTLETDHVALKWLRTVQHNNARLIRTAMELQQYDMDIVHRAGINSWKRVDVLEGYLVESAVVHTEASGAVLLGN